MRLSENQKIVEDFKQILKDYDYLEYDEARPNRDARFEGLSITITSDVDRDIQVITDICHRLEAVTRRNCFFPTAAVIQAQIIWKKFGRSSL